ncbi:MAG: DUF2723 domain-containing protein [Candidatus Baltobacteraceae bacterium]
MRFGSPWGWLALLGPLFVYGFSLQSNVAFWDTGEMQTVPYILGVAHPTGFPAFVLAGWLFTHALPFGSVAWRMSLLCALAMAVAARLAYSLGLLFDAPPPLAACGALIFAFGEIAWTHGTRAEVHAFAVVFAAAVLVAVVRWYRSGERHALWAVALALGFGLSTHPVIGLLVPGVALVALGRRRELGARDAVRFVALVLAPLLLYAYLPLRSQYAYAHRLDPTLSLGLPPGRPYWDYDHPGTLAGLRREVAGSDFDVGRGLGGVLRAGAYGRIAGRYAPLSASELGIVGVAAALFGLGAAALAEPLLLGGLCLAAFLPVPFALSYRAESDVERYFLASFWLLAVFAAVGAGRLAKALEGRSSARGAALGVLVLGGTAAALVFANRDIFEQRVQPGAAPYVDRVIGRTPANAIVIASWAFATPLAYAAYVEGRMQQRVVETAFVSDDTPYLARWTRERPVYVVSSSLPVVPGFRFHPVDAGDPMLLEVTR